MRIISILGKESDKNYPEQVRCPNECDGGDVCVNTKTGVCEFCKEVFLIQPTDFIVK